ncbi:Eyes absent-like protein 4 [Hordeum vulgare]|nr:Eyes absent-like protein 4 [Hordeum vulgare]
MVLPDSLRASACTPMPRFHVYPQASRLSGKCSPEVSVVAPSTSAPAPNDLNSTPVAGGSSSRGMRKRTRDQVSMDLDGFLLDHEFPKDYGQEEEDKCDIEGESLFKDELANQTAWAKPKRKSKRTKAYTAAEDKLLCEC